MHSTHQVQFVIPSYQYAMLYGKIRDVNFTCRFGIRHKPSPIQSALLCVWNYLGDLAHICGHQPVERILDAGHAHGYSLPRHDDPDT